MFYFIFGDAARKKQAADMLEAERQGHEVDTTVSWEVQWMPQRLGNLSLACVTTTVATYAAADTYGLLLSFM